MRSWGIQDGCPAASQQNKNFFGMAHAWSTLKCKGAQTACSHTAALLERTSSSRQKKAMARFLILPSAPVLRPGAWAERPIPKRLAAEALAFSLLHLAGLRPGLARGLKFLAVQQRRFPFWTFTALKLFLAMDLNSFAQGMQTKSSSKNLFSTLALEKRPWRGGNCVARCFMRRQSSMHSAAAFSGFWMHAARLKISQSTNYVPELHLFLRLALEVAFFLAWGILQTMQHAMAACLLKKYWLLVENIFEASSQARCNAALGRRFKESLAALTTKIYASRTHCICCIKPSHNRAAFHVDRQHLRLQLKACGVLEHQNAASRLFSKDIFAWLCWSLLSAISAVLQRRVFNWSMKRSANGLILFVWLK